MAENKDIREREKIAREIEKTSESIRKKHRALKTGRIEEDIVTKRHFEPLIEPLQKIVDNSSTHAIKEEPRDDDVETSFVQKDTTKSKIKRKRKNTSMDHTLNESYKLMRYTLNDAVDLPSIQDEQHQHTLNDAMDSPAMDSPAIASTPRMVVVQPKSLENEDVFETTDDSFAAIVRNRLQTPEGRKALSQHFGPLGQEYIGDFLSGHGEKEKIIDIVYGVYLGKDGMMLGSKKFDVDSEDNIIVDGMRYVGTPGLYELIFKRYPDDSLYTENDKRKYKNILLVTNAHKRNHVSHGRLLSNKGYKYKYIIAPLLNDKFTIGKGLPNVATLNDNAIDYVHWDDPNELVDRLRLLEASRQAGHNAHDNEMLSIIEELREAGLIIN